MQDWLVDYAFGVMAVLSAWVIGVLLILWVVVVLGWGPQDDLTLHHTVAEKPRVTVAQPRTILADGEPAAILVTLWNESRRPNRHPHRHQIANFTGVVC
ncbi:MAG: hypothetical protein IPM76_19865 [Chloroflexi bacterium]|nr:hypothetical protein [Chloroflexota bacterium]